MDQNIEPKIEQEQGKQGNKKNIIVWVIVGVIVILAVLGIWYWWVQKKVVTPVAPTAVPMPAPQAPAPTVQPSAPQVPAAPKEDSVSSINQELNSIDTGNLDQEFQAIDADLNSL